MDGTEPLARIAVAGVLLSVAVAACGGSPQLPDPRSIIVYSGERVQADPERMAEVEAWLMPQLERIDMDPDFLIRLEEFDQPTYPWETLELAGDTASIGLVRAAPDAETPYLVYGYLRLMNQWDTLASVLPDARGTSGYATERAIISQVADVWLLGRSVFDTQPFGPLDELVYSKQFGYLDEFIFATQTERFEEAAEGYRSDNPGSREAFVDWFEETFESEGPRFVLQEEADEEEEEPDADDQALRPSSPRGPSPAGLRPSDEAEIPGA